MTPEQEALVRGLLHDMGVDLPSALTAIRQAPYQEGLRLLEALKACVRKGYKRLAFELHPDRTGDDPDKTARFKLLGQLRADIEGLRLDPAPQRPPQVPVRQVVVIYRSPFVSASTASTWGVPRSASVYVADIISRMRP